MVSPALNNLPILNASQISSLQSQIGNLVLTYVQQNIQIERFSKAFKTEFLENTDKFYIQMIKNNDLLENYEIKFENSDLIKSLKVYILEKISESLPKTPEIAPEIIEAVAFQTFLTESIKIELLKRSECWSRQLLVTHLYEAPSKKLQFWTYCLSMELRRIGVEEISVNLSFLQNSGLDNGENIERFCASKDNIFEEQQSLAREQFLQALEQPFVRVKRATRSAPHIPTQQVKNAGPTQPPVAPEQASSSESGSPPSSPTPAPILARKPPPPLTITSPLSGFLKYFMCGGENRRTTKTEGTPCQPPLRGNTLR